MDDALYMDGPVGGAEKKPKKKLAGLGFVAMLFVALMKDIVDILLTLTVVLSFLIIVFDFVYWLILIAYLFVSGVRPTFIKTATGALGAVIEMVPILSAIMPMATATLITMRILENSGR